MNVLKVWDTAGTSIALSGGSLSVGSIDVSGNPSRITWAGASVDLGNGTIDSGAPLGDSLNLLAGTKLSVHDEIIGAGGLGTLTSTSATNTVDGVVTMGQNAGSLGKYSLAGTGSLSATREFIGSLGAGSFTQTGGTNSVGSDGLILGSEVSGTGTYSLSGTGSLLASYEDVAANGHGTFIQSGGTHVVSGNFALAFDSGATAFYSLSGTGYLSANAEGIGVGAFSGISGGFGSFVQSGGTHLVTTLFFGGGGATTGSYSLSGTGLLSVGTTETIAGTSPGTFVQSGGTHTVGSTLTLAGGSASGSYTLSGGSLAAANTTIGTNGIFHYNGGSFSAGNLSLTGTGNLVAGAGGGTTLSATSLSIGATASVDLSDNRMLLAYTGSATPTLNALRGYLHSGQLFSSVATSTKNLGYADRGAGSILIRYALLGDANLDGPVDVGDLGALATNYGITSGAVWAQGDFNYDGKVDVGDLGSLATNYGSTLGSGPAAIVAGETAIVAVVPEPTFVGLATLGAAGLSTRRRRQRMPHWIA
jgi:hypothetical protein